MPRLGSDSFNLGWIPSDDDVRGRANGLIRMDNLDLDENGNVSLTRGTLKASDQFGATPLTLYSETFGSIKHRYVGLNDNTVLKDVNGAGTFSETVLSGGQSETGYGTFLGDVLVCSGTQRKRDNGSFVRNINVEKPPTAPTIDVSQKYILDVIPDRSIYAVSEGTLVSADSLAATVTADTETFRVVVKADVGLDLTAIKSGVSDTGAENDEFTLWFKPKDSSRVKLVRLELLTEPEGTASDPAENYYYYEWDFNVRRDLKNKGIDVWSGLSAERQDFVKIGPDTQLDWANVQQVKVVIESANTQDVSFGEFKIEGGRGNLTGLYEWLQVNVYNNGNYDSKSPVSPFTNQIKLDHQFVKITPVAPSAFGVTQDPDEVNKIYFYRRNVDIGVWYLVAVRNDTGVFIDEVDDDTAAERIDDADARNHLPDLFATAVPEFIIGMATNYLGRVIYITFDKIYPSAIHDASVIDSGLILDVSSDADEINLFITKLTDTQLVLGTTSDIYDVTGTGTKFPDGSIDFLLRGTGTRQPPISNAFSIYDSTLVYMSSSGWRVRAGTQNQSLLGETRLLYEGETRYGIDPVLIGENNSVNYSCTVANNKLWTSVTLENGVTRRVYVYDFLKKYWYPYFINPVDLFTERDDTVLAVFGDGGDEYLRVLNTGTVLDDAGNLQTLELRTSYLDNGSPNTRKDVSVLKIYADTGNDPVEIFISKDGTRTYTSLGTFRFNGPRIQSINIAETGANLGKSFALKITADSGVSDFRFFYWTLDYVERPEQVNFIRVPPTNFGIVGRKRFYDLPFSLDSVSSSFTVTAKLDGTTVQTETFPGNNKGKLTYSIAFRDEVIGHELGIDIQVSGNNTVEFYELLTPRNVEQLPDITRFYHIPYTNLGTPARKRFVRVALVIDTRGANVTYTPLVDDVSLPPLTINTSRKQTVIYYVTTEVIGTDLGGTLDSDTETTFEFYGFDSDETVTEALPAPAKFIYVCTDFGTAARKRFSRLSFICNPRGGTISFTPILDGVEQASKSFSGNRKQTFNYFFLEDTIFIDLCFKVESATEFEFYELLKPERLEVLPEPVKYFRIPRNNLGTDQRKRFFAFAIFINTRGNNVRFTPHIDGVAQSETTVFSTNTERTAIHYFNSETVGHDIGGDLETVDGDAGIEFEFYGVNIQETISENLPGPATHLVIPQTNFGSASKKRIRTVPLVINTRGGSVTFTPRVDGVNQTSSTHNTTEKRTVFHFHETDIFGVDYGGTLDSDDDTSPFEFYGFEQPENVQILPVAKKFDQLGPVEFPRRNWIRRFRVRMVATGTALTWRLFDKDTQLDSGTIITEADKEKDYEVSMIKGMQGSIFRLEFQSTSEFHRYYVDLWFGNSGNQTEQEQQRLQ